MSNHYEFHGPQSIGSKYTDHIGGIETQEQANEYFEACVAHSMREFDMSRKEAEELERQNIGYCAGYFDHTTMAKVGKFLNAAHPVFGNMAQREPVTSEEAFKAGLEWGKKR